MSRTVYWERVRNPNEGDDDYELVLEDDGRFVYSEGTANYAWSTGVSAKGRWEAHGDEILLHVEESGIRALEGGRTVACRLQGEEIEVANQTLRKMK